MADHTQDQNEVVCVDSTAIWKRDHHSGGNIQIITTTACEVQSSKLADDF